MYITSCFYLGLGACRGLDIHGLPARLLANRAQFSWPSVRLVRPIFSGGHGIARSFWQPLAARSSLRMIARLVWMRALGVWGLYMSATTHLASSLRARLVLVRDPLGLYDAVAVWGNYT